MPEPTYDEIKERLETYRQMIDLLQNEKRYHVMVIRVGGFVATLIIFWYAWRYKEARTIISDFGIKI